MLGLNALPRSFGSFSRLIAVSMLLGGTVLFGSHPATAEDAKKDANAVIQPDELNPKGVPASLAKPPEVATFYVWQETDDTWRVKVKTLKHKHDFTGHIKVNGGKVVRIFDFTGLEAGPKKKGKSSEDFGKWNAERNEIDFKFQTHGGEDSFSFKVDPNVESITFDLKIDNAQRPKQVHVGSKAAIPPNMPFTLATGKAKPVEKPATEK